MKLKKNPKSNLENYRRLFMQLGLVTALFIVYVSIEHKTYDRVIDDLADGFYEEEDTEDIPIIDVVEPIKPPPPPPPPAPEVIEIVEDDKEVEETVIESTETDEEEAVEVDEIIEEEEEEEVIEDVPFAIIEDVPVYPGCENTRGNTARKECFSKKVRNHVNRKFDGDLADDLGLRSGKQRIIVMFKVDKTGSVVGVRARGPHKKLEQEAVKVIRSLPRMTPGKQRGRPVGVTYSLPIVFKVP